MGNCYKVHNTDKDLLSDIDPLERINTQKKLSNIDMMANNQEKNINDINLTEEQKIIDMFYLSKTLLKLTVKQSKNLEEGKEYIINSLGLLINNENKTRDGLTIFGDVNVIKYFINILNIIIQTNTRADFIFPEEESNTKQNHAEIRYDKTLDLYQIRSLRGNGCFLKIDQKIVSYLMFYNIQLLKDEDIFSFSFFMIRVRIDIKSEEINNVNTVIASLLTLEVLFGGKEKRKKTFDSRKKQIIRIGRIKNDEIDFNFNDEDVSRKQCMIIFEENNWYIVDGNGIQPSSNGTWFYPEKYYNINEGLIIRMGTTLFECNYLQEN